MFDIRLLTKLNGMKKTLVLILAVAFGTIAYSEDKLEVFTRDFYTALNKGDSADIVPFFHSNCLIKHVGESDVWELPLNEFLGVCPKFKSQFYAEDVVSTTIHHVGHSLIYVDVYFDFYVEGSYDHSGVDHFCWTFRGGELRIESIYSTVLSDGIPLLETSEDMDKFMNKWHQDVANFNFESYFQFMTDEFIFLGTDPSERWTKQAFGDYAKPHFDRKATWDFKTNWRNWYFSDDHQVAWFEESLATQMEECRGSGVLVKTDLGWKITHYNLAVVIENEKMKKFIKLRRK